MLRNFFIAGCLSLAVIVTSLTIGTATQASLKAGDITGGKAAPHLNIAAFHKLHGQESFVFPQHISGGNIISALQGSAQFLFMNHTSGLQNGDVVMVTNDVLRDNAGSFEDFGVGCQLSVQLKAQKGVQISGLCEFLMVDKDHRQIEHKGIIKPVTLESGKDWILVYNNQEDGIAIYADEEFGLE